MSKPSLFCKHARKRVDVLVRRGLFELRRNGRAQAAFTQLLVAARERSTLLRPVTRGPAVELAIRALVHLARNHGEFVASAMAWRGGDGSLWPLVGSLASHMVGPYPAPSVMTSAWFLDDSSLARRQRRWFIDHARGRPLREAINLSVPLTRRMERIFLASPAHLSIPAACRRAELLALGAEPELAQAVLGTDAAEDVEHGAFWREVMHFFVNHWAELDAERVQAIVRYVYAVKLRPHLTHSERGTRVRAPPQPDFSIRGRTPQSLDRLVSRWQVVAAEHADEGRQWSSSGLSGFAYEQDARLAHAGPTHWRIVELLHTHQLWAEGRALRHCVGTYGSRCMAGISSLWSLRRRSEHGQLQSRFTIEIDPRLRSVVQIRGHRNRRIDGEPLHIVALWATTQGLSVARGA